MKNLILSVAALAIVFVSCSDDDDSSGGDNTTGVAQAAVLDGGPYTFCVDGLEDRVMDDVVSDPGSGTNSTFVITDTDLNILGTPPVVSGPDFDGAGVCVCYIWHLNYEGDPDTFFDGVENADDLTGDFALSNRLTVNREDCAPSVVAATLEVGPSAMNGEYTFTVDGTADNVTDLVVADAGAGENAQIVVTDENGWILGLPPVFEGPDFDAAGVGVCYIRHVNYDGDVSGLTGPVDGAPTANINDLEGEFKISNIIVVNRI